MRLDRWVTLVRLDLQGPLALLDLLGAQAPREALVQVDLRVELELLDLRELQGLRV